MFITAVCVLFLIKLRWPKNKSPNKLVLQLHGTHLVIKFRSGHSMHKISHHIYAPLILRTVLRVF